VCVCVCSLRYPARNAYAPHCHLCSAGALRYLSTLCNKRHDFLKRKGIEHKMCVLIFSINFVWSISHPKNVWARYDQKCLFVSLWRNHYSCQIVMKRVSSVDFRKIFKCPVLRKPFQSEPNCSIQTDSQTDREDEAYSRLSQFCKSAEKTDKWHNPQLHTFTPKATSCCMCATYNNCGKEK